MASPDDRPVDESQDLGDRTDDRDRGYGFIVEDDEVVQLDPEDEGDPEED